MIVRFEGFDYPIEAAAGVPSTVEVENNVLFARMCQSLISGEGRYSVEPYSLWEGDEEVRPKGAFHVLSNPFALPYSERWIEEALYSRFDGMLLEDEAARSEIEALESKVRAAVALMGFRMNSDYVFGVEWQLRRYLKAFSFGVERDGGAPLIDNLLNYCSLLADASCEKTILAINLKTFLSKCEVESLYERVFFLNLRMVLLENKHDDTVYEREWKRRIDLDFLES